MKEIPRKLLHSRWTGSLCWLSGKKRHHLNLPTSISGREGYRSTSTALAAAASNSTDSKSPFFKDPTSLPPSNSSVSVPFYFTQQGVATLVAHVSPNSGSKTRVQVSHKSPCRWIPIINSNGDSAKTVVVLGHYGGGMAAGDSATVDISVHDGAVLHCTSQGTNRVYKKRLNDNVNNEHATAATLVVKCGANAKCWMTPDPTQLQRNANYQQQTKYQLHESSSLIAVDWISAGRLTAGERWDFDACRLRTSVAIHGKVVFVDAQDLPTSLLYGMDFSANVQFQTFGTIVLYKTEEAVVERFRHVQRDLCRPHTAVRSSSSDDENRDTTTSPFPVASVLSGRVIMGMSSSEKAPDLHIVRFTAESNEDMFRILHYCISDNCYGERIRAVQSAPPIRVERLSAIPCDFSYIPSPPVPHERSSSMSLPSSSSGMLLMADSMFPIGSFAHSFGLEVASQLGLFKSSRHVVHYLHASLRSTVQQAIPLIRVPITDPTMWQATNDYADCLLWSNPPAYRASIEQAKNLQRIMDALGNNNNSSATTANRIGEISPRIVHFAPLWGQAATTTFGMTEAQACHAFLYTMARDLVSAAVRMNLLGPMEGQTLLWKQLVSLATTNKLYDPALSPALDDATTAAPAMEAIQPCHDLLAMRLFRS